MKFFMVIAKCGHVGKNYYYKGTLFVKAMSGKEAAKIARECPRVKHDRKDAILSVKEIDSLVYDIGSELNRKVRYFSCENVQEQRMYFSEIENNVFAEDWIQNEPKKYAKKHGLRNVYNWDPEYESYNTKSYIDSYAA